MQRIELQIPPEKSWAVAISGGADSVALLLLLAARSDLQLHVVHLDHELRGDASRGDADFVRQLAARLNLPFTMARLSEIEPALVDPPTNPSALYRAARLELFRRVVEVNHLAGVMLAHHADDVAETVLQRLLRGSSFAGLTGIAADSTINNVRVFRPLLHLHRKTLRTFLAESNQPFRQDASNESDDYLRNRLRKILDENPELTAALLDLAKASRGLFDWTDQSAPTLSNEFPAVTLRSLPPLLAHRAAARWLQSAGSPPETLSPEVLDRLITMAADAATPAKQQFPGNLTIRRRAGKLFAARP